MGMMNLSKPGSAPALIRLDPLLEGLLVQYFSPQARDRICASCKLDSFLRGCYKLRGGPNLWLGEQLAPKRGSTMPRLVGPEDDGDRGLDGVEFATRFASEGLGADGVLG